MTVLEATNKLIEWFAGHEWLELGQHFLKIVLVSDTEEADKAALEIALEELAKENFVIKKEINQKQYWILFKPLGMHAQNVQMTLMTALELTNVINRYITEESQKISPLRISEQDILNLIEIAKRA